MSEPSNILSAQERARLVIAELAKTMAPFAPPAKPPQPAWITASMRVAALLFVALILAAMAGGVFGIWRWAFSVAA